MFLKYIFVTKTKKTEKPDIPSIRTDSIGADQHDCVSVLQCRVMRNLERTNQKGVSKSLGYAFVNFSTHEHALKALKGLNNCTVFGDHKVICSASL